MLNIVNTRRLDAMLFGDNASDFSIADSNCPPSLGINHTCSISFNFTPSGIGKRTAHIVLADNSPSGPHIIPIQGMGAGTTLEIAANSAQFPPFPVGQMSGPIVVYPYANGDQPIQFSSINVTGQNATDFQISSNTCGTTLQPYRTCAVTLTFQPTAAGGRSATLVLAGDFETSARQIPLFGTGF
jgi:type 1 fimbria pilin